MSDNYTLAFLYLYIYLFIVLFLSISAVSKYTKKRSIVPNKYIYDNQKKTLILSVFMAIFIGIRPIHEIFIDMPQYYGIYERFDGFWTFSFNTENIIYDNLMFGLASIRFEPVLFYLLISSIYFICTYFACKRLFPNDAYIAYLVFLAAFSTFSYGTNGIKAGAAASIFLLALSYRERLIPCLALMAVSLGFHHSMVLPIAAFTLTLFFKNPKWYFYGWVFSAVMAAGHVSFFQNIFAGFADERGADYLGANGISDTAYISGFRPDFILYSAMPVWVGYIAKFKKGIQSKMYDTLLYTYITANAVWMLCMYASFTNRIAYLSWFLYPIVLIYPFLNENWGENRYRQFAKVATYHLCFTLFMEMIYYGGILKLLGI